MFLSGVKRCLVFFQCIAAELIVVEVNEDITGLADEVIILILFPGHRD